MIRLCVKQWISSQRPPASTQNAAPVFARGEKSTSGVYTPVGMLSFTQVKVATLLVEITPLQVKVWPSKSFLSRSTQVLAVKCILSIRINVFIGQNDSCQRDNIFLGSDYRYISIFSCS